MLGHRGFDLWADGYDRDVEETDAADAYPFAGYRAVLGRVYQAVRARVRAGSVLDIGCGTGTVLRRLHADGYHVTGLDFSQRMIALARERIPGAEFIRCDFARGLPDALAGRAFDAIISTYALHHLEEERHAAFIRMLVSRLSPGGILAVGDISFRTRAERDALADAEGEAWDGAEHYFAYDALSESLKMPSGYEKLSVCAGVLTLRRPSA